MTFVMPDPAQCIILNCAGLGITSAAKQFVYTKDENEEDPGKLFYKIAAYYNSQTMNPWTHIFFGILTGNQVLVLITF